jgi:hypothetical protein
VLYLLSKELVTACRLFKGYTTPFENVIDFKRCRQIMR